MTKLERKGNFNEIVFYIILLDTQICEIFKKQEFYRKNRRNLPQKAEKIQQKNIYFC
jgi:hypothetical protein